MKSRKILPIFLLLTAAVTACGPAINGLTASDVIGPQVWFDAPLPSTICVPPSPCHMVVHGSDPSGITQFEFQVDEGSPVEFASPDTQASLVTYTSDWMPPGPGTYNLRMRAMNNNGDWSGWAVTDVVVADEEVQDEAAPTAETVAVTPTATPEILQPASIEITGLSNNVVYYRGDSCGSKELIVQVHAVHPDGIKVVVLFHRLRSQSNGSETAYNSKAMNPIGADYYEITLNPENMYGGGTLASYGNTWLDLQAVIQSNPGDTSIRTPVLSEVTVAPCGGGAEAQPTISLFLFPLVTVTPTPVEIK